MFCGTVITTHLSNIEGVVRWSPEMVDAFHCLYILCNESELCVLVVSDKFTLCIDASGKGIGAVLSVEQDGQEMPTVYFSRQLMGGGEGGRGGGGGG